MSKPKRGGKKGLSITEIAKTMQVNWRTAKKYGDGDQLPQEKTQLKKGMMYDEKWGEIVMDWLEEDLKLKKKLRRKNKKIYEDLVKDGFQGSYRTVCNFIQEWKASQEDEADKGYERLDYPEGEAQVDFGIMEAVHDGEILDVHALIMSFPASNTAFAVPMPSENLECFLGGLQLLFKQAGGVPLSIRIDNLTPAVRKVRKGDSEAQLTDTFRHFQQYYGLKVQVCNPRKGNEKGHVEGKVGYVRYNFFSLPPVIKVFEDLTNQLEQQLIADRQRIHYKKEVLIDELWQQEQKQLIKLPEAPYPVFKQFSIKFNKYNEFKLDGHLIHVPKAKNYVQLSCVTYWDSYKIITNDGEILLSDARPYMKKRRFIPWQDILKDWLKKPRVVGYSRYANYLPTHIKEVPFTNAEEYMYQILLKEQQGREQAKIARNLKQARFIDTKTLESYQWHKDICLPSHLTKDELEQLNFIRRKENVILVGAPSTGKTHLASALGRKACEQGYEVRFYRISHLVEELEQALHAGKLKQFRNKLEKVDLMILDEMGYLPFGKEGAELLFQIISEFYEQKSLIITSNLEFSQWNRIFSDSRLTAALVDRLIHHAHIISYTGQSFRLTNALSRK